MKTKTIALAAMAGLILPAAAKDRFAAKIEPLDKEPVTVVAVTPPELPEASAPMKLPVGQWKVEFENGVSQICDVHASGKVNVVQPQRISDGKAVSKIGAVEVQYEDDRLERWSMDGAKLVVEHWHPISARDDGKPPVVGVANRFLNVSWNDQISSMKLGANARVIAYEHGGYGGRSITLDAGGSYPVFLDLKRGLNGPERWNNRISSLKIVSAGKGTDAPSDNQVVIYDNSQLSGNALTLEAGDEIPELTKVIIGAIQYPLEVHEWGTFTVLQGSDGKVIEWYQAPDKLVGLPPFVRRVGIGGKSGRLRLDWLLASRLDTVRMETPVLYFYPAGEMDITVTAGFPKGRITEVFPPSTSWTPDATVWRGRLVAPDSPLRANIPEAKGPSGRHYAAARAVPEAWLFQGQGTHMPDLPAGTAEKARRSIQNWADAENKKSIDHFIFYRGAGNPGSFAISAVQLESPGTYQLTNRNPAAIPKLFALQVRDGQTAWTTIDGLQPLDYRDGQTLNQQTFTFPAPAGSAEEVAGALRSAMVDSLHSEGLTEPEAASMVATWDNLWFTEPGTRVLAVLPQTFADEMVPLTITPTPKSIDRVFVARLELITREKEAVLTGLLNTPAGERDQEADREMFAALELGRYAAGGMERARALAAQQIRTRFAELSKPPAKKTGVKRGLGAVLNLQGASGPPPTEALTRTVSTR